MSHWNTQEPTVLGVDDAEIIQAIFNLTKHIYTCYSPLKPTSSYTKYNSSAEQHKVITSQRDKSPVCNRKLAQATSCIVPQTLACYQFKAKTPLTATLLETPLCKTHWASVQRRAKEQLHFINLIWNSVLYLMVHHHKCFPSADVQ